MLTPEQERLARKVADRIAGERPADAEEMQRNVDLLMSRRPFSQEGPAGEEFRRATQPLRWILTVSCISLSVGGIVGAFVYYALLKEGKGTPIPLVAGGILAFAAFAAVVAHMSQEGGGRSSPLERVVGRSWLVVRFTLCLAAAALAVGTWLRMAITWRAPNGTPVDPVTLLVLLPIVGVAAYLLLWVGLYGKLSRFSSLASDRDVHGRRVARYRASRPAAEQDE